MTKNERKYLYELIKKYLAINPNWNHEERNGGISVIHIIQYCEESKDKFKKRTKLMEDLIQQWEDNEND